LHPKRENVTPKRGIITALNHPSNGDKSGAGYAANPAFINSFPRNRDRIVGRQYLNLFLKGKIIGPLLAIPVAAGRPMVNKRVVFYPSSVPLNRRGKRERLSFFVEIL
jgi:hypothetical protein